MPTRGGAMHMRYAIMSRLCGGLRSNRWRMVMEIEGKRVLVTGANRGLGHALMLACARAGAHKVVAGPVGRTRSKPLRLMSALAEQELRRCALT